MMWCRTCACVDSELSPLLPLVSQTPYPACSYFSILPRPWCLRILLTSSDLNSSVCLMFLVLCFLPYPFCAGFLTALVKSGGFFFVCFLCTLLLPLPFFCLLGSLFCSYSSFRKSQPSGMCRRSRLCAIKLLVVFHNIEVSQAFAHRCGSFPTEQQFLPISMLLSTDALQYKWKSCTLWSQKEGDLYRASGRVGFLTCLNNSFFCAES